MQALWGEGGSERPVASSGASSSLLRWYARAAGKRGLGSILLGGRPGSGAVWEEARSPRTMDSRIRYNGRQLRPQSGGSGTVAQIQLPA